MTTHVLQEIHQRHVRIDRLIRAFPDCPRPASYRVDRHLSRAEQLEAAWLAFTVTQGARY